MAGAFMNFFSRACAFCQAIRVAFVGVANLVMFALSVFGSYMLYQWIVDDQPVLEFGKGTASASSVQPSDTISFFSMFGSFGIVQVGSCRLLVVTAVIMCCTMRTRH